MTSFNVFSVLVYMVFGLKYITKDMGVRKNFWHKVLSPNPDLFISSLPQPSCQRAFFDGIA